MTRNDNNIMRNEHMPGTTGFQKDNVENIEPVRKCYEERCRTHTEYSVEDGYAYKSKGREDGRKQDGNTRASET